MSSLCSSSELIQLIPFSRAYIIYKKIAFVFFSQSASSFTGAWRGLFAILISLDEQSADTRTAPALHNSTVGHISSRIRWLCALSSVCVCSISVALERTVDATDWFSGTFHIFSTMEYYKWCPYNILISFLILLFSKSLGSHVVATKSANP